MESLSPICMSMPSIRTYSVGEVKAGIHIATYEISQSAPVWAFTGNNLLVPSTGCRIQFCESMCSDSTVRFRNYIRCTRDVSVIDLITIDQRALCRTRTRPCQL